MKTDIETFYDKVMPEPNTGCWLWYGAINWCGYGLMYKNVRAHRVSYELHKGPIPKGMGVLHKCDTPICVNPDHLYVGSQKDNMADVLRRNRQNNALGEFNGKSKLTKESIIEIKTSPLKKKELAKKFGVTQVTIGDILRGRTWSHIQI